MLAEEAVIFKRKVLWQKDRSKKRATRTKAVRMHTERQRRATTVEREERPSPRLHKKLLRRSVSRR